MKLLIALIATIAVWVCAPDASAVTLTIGPDGLPMSWAEALKEARDGDTIEILPGTYKGAVGVIKRNKLTIRGVGERPVFEADGKSAEGKAIWVIRGGEVEVENIEFRGARVRDANGAGIRFERGQLLIRNCRFIDNENGLLTSNASDAELRIENSTFMQVPRAKGTLPHLLYVGWIASVTITGSRFHQGFEGHLIKSRAKVTRLENNLIVDGPGGEASYEIDLPNGGDVVIVGNVIGQSRDTQNPVMVAYGAERRRWDSNRLLMSHNTLVSDFPMTWFLRSWPDKLGPDTQIRAINNLTVGTGLFTLASSGDFDGNWPTTAGSLIDPMLLDFELQRDSWLRGRADDPRTLAGDAAVPTAEFVLPIGTRPLKPPAAWSPGALQR